MKHLSKSLINISIDIHLSITSRRVLQQEWNNAHSTVYAWKGSDHTNKYRKEKARFIKKIVHQINDNESKAAQKAWGAIQ